MPNCELIIDSCCDLSPDLIDTDQITLLNFSYEMDGGTFKDDLFQTRTAEDFYNAMKNGSEPTTSQLSISLLTETFTDLAERNTPGVYLSFSSGLSGSFDIANLVYEQVKAKYPNLELYLVDTRLASIAEGLLVFEAMKQWEGGLCASELAQWAQEAIYFVDEKFMVEDLNTLRRGGRIPASVAVAGSALDVKPLLTIDLNGKLQLTGVARGRKKAIKQLAAYYEDNVDRNGTNNYVFIGHSNCPKDANRLREMLEKLDDSTVIIESAIGPVIGSHVGPGMLAISFWGKDKRENLSVSDKIVNKIKGSR